MAVDPVVQDWYVHASTIHAYQNGHDESSPSDRQLNTSVVLFFLMYGCLLHAAVGVFVVIPPRALAMTDKHGGKQHEELHKCALFGTGLFYLPQKKT
jgi:hypothetical protein